MKIHHFTKKTHLSVPVETAFAWHERPGAIDRLTPPWEEIQIISQAGGIEAGAQTYFKVKAGPVWLKWLAHHMLYEKNKMFQDIQRHGPFLFWEHNHQFEPDGTHACFLTDSIRFRLPFTPLSDVFALKTVKKRLYRMFEYRHAVTQHDLKLLANYQDNQKIVITGASGVLGAALVPFLRTQGHSVTRIVRQTPQLEDEAFWNPYRQEIDTNAFENADTVIHLAGEYIGDGRWTKKKKKRIIDSRVKGTQMIAETISNMKSPPKTLICASAIGYYGNRGIETITEASTPGNDFISDVCTQWENAAAAAIDKGIRVIFLRIGIVLTPRGGALERLLPLYKTGLGMILGDGAQMMSWISEDDFLGVVNHVIHNPTISGPVNVTSPNPVSQQNFSNILAQSLARPAFIHLPQWIITPLFGQMGNEVLLAGNCVIPEKLMVSNYSFLHPKLEDALQHLLGLYTFDPVAASQFETIRGKGIRP